MKINLRKELLYSIFMIVTLTAAASSSFAKANSDDNSKIQPIPELTNYIHDEVSRINEAIMTSSTQEATSDNYFLKNMLIRLRATFGIEVTWVAKFEIVPEVELVYLREMR